MDLTKKKDFIKLHAFDWKVEGGKMRVVLALGQDWAEIDSLKMMVLEKEKKEKDSLLKKVANYAKAEASLIMQGSVDDEIYNGRIETCKKCSYLIKSDDPIGHCNDCGCGTRKRAGLTVKCKMPEAKCPKDKWKK